ncbi:abc-type multidrug transport atpase an [Tubulinosema ratisbonensis]|uniref:Transcription initiation factor TFIID subunit 8 n=1 Tax=Tubulinosema ratisbonensis TaxID=291195 RepID=A0A437AMV4_9MICR|nr:abc-type multidrug transport atpase an [Tubulinosema ratisbonensis]
MKKVLAHCIARALKNTGFDSFNQKAMHYFIEITELYMQRVLICIKNNSAHCGRSRTTLLDLINKIPLEEVFSFDYVDYPHETEEKKENYVSPISAQVEKFMYIYEFMPPFPSLHTFKETIIKEKRTRSRARDVKDRIEQRNKIIESLFVLAKASKKKKFINYLYDE